MACKKTRRRRVIFCGELRIFQIRLSLVWYNDFGSDGKFAWVFERIDGKNVFDLNVVLARKRVDRFAFG
jgi:hypothetical protein